MSHNMGPPILTQTPLRRGAGEGAFTDSRLSSGTGLRGLACALFINSFPCPRIFWYDFAFYFAVVVLCCLGVGFFVVFVFVFGQIHLKQMIKMLSYFPLGVFSRAECK